MCCDYNLANELISAVKHRIDGIADSGEIQEVSAATNMRARAVRTIPIDPSLRLGNTGRVENYSLHTGHAGIVNRGYQQIVLSKYDVPTIRIGCRP